jgi:tetratricopeptide (TPR) repeat protein
MAYHRFAELLYIEGEESEAIKRWQQAIELDPLTGTFYYRMGSAIADMGQEKADEGERLMALGLEIDPDLETEWRFE